jgi:hypothetical protein
MRNRTMQPDEGEGEGEGEDKRREREREREMERKGQEGWEMEREVSGRISIEEERKGVGHCAKGRLAVKPTCPAHSPVDLGCSGECSILWASHRLELVAILCVEGVAKFCTSRTTAGATQGVRFR